MKMKEESTKAGLHLNVKKTNIITKGVHNFNMDNEDTVEDFANLGSVINSNGNCSQEVRKRQTQRGSHGR